jgi:cell division protein FtsQ
VFKTNRIVKLVATFLLLPAVLFISLFSLEQQGFFKINEIKISVSVKASQKDFIRPYVETLNQKLDLFKGTPLWKLSLKQVSEIMKLEPWIIDFRVSRAWPSGLEIEIEPHEVAFLIQAKDARVTTEFYPVTLNGMILKKVDSRQAPPVAIMRGEQFLKNQKVREGVVSVLKSLPADGKLHTSHVSEIGYDKKDGYWISLSDTNMKIKFGEDQFEIKSSRVSQVMDYLENHELKARVIDANLSKKVLVRLH